ncbi:MAG: hypothetical protein ABSH46_20980 [Bryobacteraceae bacterium]|jgi:hypothetical protein
MRHIVRWLILLPVLAVLLLPFVAEAMDQPHYDLDSLAYMSTDIVIATLSVDTKQRITVTVTDTVYGSLHAGDKLDMLSEFLAGFFRPMEDGQRIVLFLDGRPHQPYLLYPEASKSPFAVPPSGVYLIDAYEHVHEYYQRDNPGPYVAQGYGFFLKASVPTKEEDLALPSLQEVRARILASWKWVQPIRTLLDKVATRDDVPALIKLTDERSKAHKACGHEMGDAILERLGVQLRSLNDPDIALRSYSLAPDWRAPIDFVQPANGNRDTDFTATRAKYLVRTLSDTKTEMPLRAAAAEILLDLSRFRSLRQTVQTDASPSSNLPFDNAWLSPSSSEILAAARTVFDDPSQDGHLRSLCLRLLPFDQPDVVADVKQTYGRARSEELRFTIEEAFLHIGDGLYESLNPPGGPIASMVGAAPERGCVVARADHVAFLLKFRERQDSVKQWGLSLNPQFVLTNLRTGQSFTPKIDFLSGSLREFSGERGLELSQSLDLPVGDYSMAPEYSRDGKVFSTGHGLVVGIADTPRGKKLSVKPVK